MSSDGGNSAVGRDAVGHRGGSQQRRGSGREAGSDLSSCSSKKKQKDRANQESREAKRAVAVVDGVIAEVKKGNNKLTLSLLCQSAKSDLRCAVNVTLESLKLSFPWHQSHQGEEGLVDFFFSFLNHSKFTLRNCLLFMCFPWTDFSC